MENIINTLKTRREVEEYRTKINEMCDKRNEFIVLCEQANSLSEKSFGYIKEAFEVLSPSLFKSSEGKKLINKYTKVVKENKNLYSLHSIYENIRKAGKDMDVDFFVNNLANVEWNVDGSTLKEDTYKLGRILTEAYLFIGKEAESMLPKENKSLSMAVEYIAENKKNKKNIAEYSNAVKVIKECVLLNESSQNIFECATLGKTTEELLKEFNEKYSDKLTAEEINILKEISGGQDKETIFNKYKEACATKITEAKKTFDINGDKVSSDRLRVVLEQISNKTFSLDTVGTDICSLMELSKIFE
jgi:23S rRNA pseudoU1915 N3-methylase RlmH